MRAATAPTTRACERCAECFDVRPSKCRMISLPPHDRIPFLSGQERTRPRARSRSSTSSPPSHRDDHHTDHHRDEEHQRSQDQRDHLPVVGAEPASNDSEDLHARTPFRGSDLTCILRARGGTGQTDIDSSRREEAPIPAWVVVAEHRGLPRDRGLESFTSLPESEPGYRARIRRPLMKQRWRVSARSTTGAARRPPTSWPEDARGVRPLQVPFRPAASVSRARRSAA